MKYAYGFEKRIGCMDAGNTATFNDCTVWTDNTTTGNYYDYITGNYYDYLRVDDYQREPSPDEYQKHLEAYLKLQKHLENQEKKIEGVEMKTLYNVYLVYGENRKQPVIKQARGVIANGDEDAKIKSGLMKEVQEDWDADYLTFICEEIGEVNIKERPKEVKQV